MRRASWVVRIAVAVVSFCYMLLLLPHFISGGVQFANMRYAIYDAGLVVTFVWLPVVMLHLRAGGIETRRLATLSLLPAIFVCGFFALLFAGA
jgi:hypothetical protein